MPAYDRWIVLVEWVDQENYDADEIVVTASSQSEAEATARQRWWATNGAEWPTCRIRRVGAIAKDGRALSLKN